jgi:ribonuclease HII
VSAFISTAIKQRSVTAKPDLVPAFQFPVNITRPFSCKAMAPVRRSSRLARVKGEDNSATVKVLEELSPNPPVPKVLTKAGPTREAEMLQWADGYKRVAGVDEAGRGPLAGPVVAAACILPQDCDILRINDSKKLSEADRDSLYDLITNAPGVEFAVSVVDAGTIDEINILEAAMLAMANAVKSLQPDFALIDGNRIPKQLDASVSKAIIRGDALSTSIAAASIIAKVTRDRLMYQFHEQWPEYGFKAHKGYGTVVHTEALKRLGPVSIHRRSFQPLRGWLEQETNLSE